MVIIYSMNKSMADNTSECLDPHNDYLTAVLSDFGLQLSPGGTSIKEIELPPLSSVWESRKYADTIEGCSSDSRSAPSLSPPMKRSCQEDTSKDEAPGNLVIDEEYDSDAKKSLSLPESKKTKKYEMPPSEDPILEKKRRNAIIAWKNRAKKKCQMKKMENTMKKMTQVNKRSCNALQRTIDDNMLLKQELKKAEVEKRLIIQEKHAKEVQLHDMQDKLILFREHLSIVNHSMEEGTFIKRLISVLINHLDVSLGNALPLALPTAVQPNV